MDTDDLDLLRQLDKPRLIIERKRSPDERSISDLSIAGNIRNVDSYENMLSPIATGARSGWNSPSSSSPHALEPHPMVVDAWDALRRSLVYFRELPVGTMAAVDNQSEEVLNYDKVFCNFKAGRRGLTALSLVKELCQPASRFFMILSGKLIL